MPELNEGLFEVLVTELLQTELARLDESLVAVRARLSPEEAPGRIALHVAGVVERALAMVEDKKRPQTAIELARRLVDTIAEVLCGTGDWAAERPSVDGEPLLRAVVGRRLNGKPEPVEAPDIPLHETWLLTNARDEPRVGHQILREIRSADRIDVVMAFIRRSGLAPILDSLREHCASGRPLRVLTTVYTGTTEPGALDALRDCGAEVRVSYDTLGTRLHAKAWLFHRRSGATTGYIGSSNLTHAAQITGQEWNVRLSAARNRSAIEKMVAVFESYWNSPHFRPYDAEEFRARVRHADDEGASDILLATELRPEPFQERLLELLRLAREQGRHRNLLVAATGTGKTVMAALDYAFLRSILPRSRLLFVAHREEILRKSRATFRQALRDPSFGELWVGGERPRTFEHVFASVQSLDRSVLARFPPEHFDVVVVDEFHHAAAPSYRALLDRVRPRELLGLTATPERSDGLPVLDWFGGRIAAELRLWDAIEQQYLVPFVYYGVHDGTDLRELPWRRGRGYDAEGLSNLLTADDFWARLVLRELRKRVGDPARMRALGFCVGKDHARFMARTFHESGVRAEAVTSDTPEDERRRVLDDLAARRINAIFSIDLFNEGVDVPEIDTLLMLRPTDSPTLFLQQLGRGLRRSREKSVCTVLDFVGHHRREFRFDRRFRALLGGTRSSLEHALKEGFPFLPAGCHMELDPVARKIVLDNIRDAIPSRRSERVAALRHLAEAEGGGVTLGRYLEETGLELEDVYTGGQSWSDLREAAALIPATEGAYEGALRRSCGRFLHVDDPLRLESHLRFLRSRTPPDPAGLSADEHRLVRMLVCPLFESARPRPPSLAAAVAQLWGHRAVREELVDLFTLLLERLARESFPLSGEDPVPLRLHARYRRSEILAGFGLGEELELPPWREGVFWARGARADLLTFTLDKTDARFTPSTRYRDYAVNAELIHWQSQSNTAAGSETGRRYREHAKRGTRIMLFARERKGEPFCFLGPATYVSHESEKPMNILWRLEHPLTGDMFTTFAAAAA